MKGKRFRRHIAELAETLEMDPSYLERELGVGFSGGEKKKLEMLQLLLLKPRLAILDETDSGLDVDALGVVSRGIRAYRDPVKEPSSSSRITPAFIENLPIDRMHVIADGRLVRKRRRIACGRDRSQPASTPPHATQKSTSSATKDAQAARALFRRTRRAALCNPPTTRRLLGEQQGVEGASCVAADMR